MRALQALSRLGVQSARLGSRRFHPNSPGDLVPDTAKYRKFMQWQSFFVDKLNSGVRTHQARGTSDRVIFHFAWIMTAALVGMVTKDLIYNGCLPKENK